MSFSTSPVPSRRVRRRHAPLTHDGKPIAAISAAVDATEADRLDAVGEELKKAVATLGRKFDLHAS